MSPRQRLSSGISVSRRGMRLSSRLARLEALPQTFGVEIAADEHQPALMLLAVLPGALVVAFDDHVNALDDVAVRIVLERDDAFEAQNVRAFHLGGLLDPREKLLRVHLAG